MREKILGAGDREEWFDTDLVTRYCVRVKLRLIETCILDDRCQSTSDVAIATSVGLSHEYARVQRCEFFVVWRAHPPEFSVEVDHNGAPAWSQYASDLASCGDWISKIGADGVQVMASKSRGEAFAIKISDGNKPALFVATVMVLEQLGWMDEVQAAELDVWRGADILSARGLAVGTRRACFGLEVRA